MFQKIVFFDALDLSVVKGELDMEIVHSVLTTNMAFDFRLSTSKLLLLFWEFLVLGEKIRKQKWKF